MKKIHILKHDQKALAKKIRLSKQQRKTYRNGFSLELLRDQWQYRHAHIAYCLLRGRSMEQIERKVREGNEPSQKLIDKYMEAYREEIICDSVIEAI